MNNKGFLIAGIHTGIGKTMCAAILTEALECDYWKPIQAGDLQNSDSIFVRQHLSNPHSVVHAEAYKLQTPASPHTAAAIDQIEIDMHQLHLPESKRPIVVETAGGIMSPVNNSNTMLDLALQLQLPVILVAQNYLGSINHTLLSIAAIQQTELPLIGLIWNGTPDHSARSFVAHHTRLTELFAVPLLEKTNKQTVAQLAALLRKNIQPFVAPMF